MSLVKMQATPAKDSLNLAPWVKQLQIGLKGATASAADAWVVAND